MGGLGEGTPQPVPAVAGGCQLGLPAGHEFVGRLVPLDAAGGPSGDRRGSRPALAEAFEVLGDLIGPLRQHLARLRWDAGDAPVAEPTGRAVVSFDAIAELDRLVGRVQPADGCGGVQHVAERGGVERLPAAALVGHGDDVGDEDVVVGSGVAGSAGGVAGDGPREPVGRGAGLGPASAAAPVTEPVVEVGEGGVALGVEDGVHVLGLADHPEYGDGLVGGDDELDAGPAGGDQPPVLMRGVPPHRARRCARRRRR